MNQSSRQQAGKTPQLNDGQTAPGFEVTDMTGQRHKLSDYDGQKLLLCFFRYAACPFCNLALHRLTMTMPQLNELNLKVLAFIQSEPQNIQHYIYERHSPAPTFPIIADPQRKIYDLYGVHDSLKPLKRGLSHIPPWLKASLRQGYVQGKVDGSLSLVPAHFLIGPYDSTIYKASYGNDYFQDWPLLEILDFAQFGPVYEPPHQAAHKH